MSDFYHRTYSEYSLIQVPSITFRLLIQNDKWYYGRGHKQLASALLPVSASKVCFPLPGITCIMNMIMIKDFTIAM